MKPSRNPSRKVVILLRMCPVCRSTLEPSPLCEASLGGDTRFHLVECPGCSTRYLSPLPTSDQLEKVYAGDYYGSDWYKQRGMGAAFASLTLRNRTPGKFLDVGCGLGFFIDGIRSRSKWSVCGIEFGTPAVEFARNQLGLDVRHGQLWDAQFSDHSFDYILVRNVLEHVTEPVRLLRECRRILKSDGVLNLSVPNGRIDSLNLIKFYQSERRPPYSKTGHLFFFPREALLGMFQTVGFEVIRSRTFGIRRGLASLGLWPLLKDWKRHYQPRPHPEQTGSSRVVLAKNKYRPGLYYSYRLFRMNAKMLPGMRSFGLDYELLLKPASAATAPIHAAQESASQEQAPSFLENQTTTKT